MGNPNLGVEGRPYQFTSSRQPANAGRKPSRLKKYIKDNSLSAIDVSIIARVLLNKSREEIQKLVTDPKVPILVSGAAAALLKDMAKGNTFALQWLTDRGVGKTPEKLISVTEDLTTLTQEERHARLDELIKNYQDRVRGSGDAGAGQPEGAPGRVEETQQEKPGTPEITDHD